MLPYPLFKKKISTSAFLFASFITLFSQPSFGMKDDEKEERYQFIPKFGEKNERNSPLSPMFTTYSKEEKILVRKRINTLEKKLQSKIKLEKDDLDFMVNLGLRHLHGEEGIQKNVQKTVFYWEQAANQGHPGAALNLGLLHSHANLHITPNIPKAIKYFKMIEENDQKAQFQLGQFYLRGEGCEKDLEKSRFYLEKAEKTGCITSAWLLGESYLEGDKNIKKDNEKARDYLTKAADKGILTAAYYLGYIYLMGEGISEDINKGIHYLTMAEEEPDTPATYMLGIVHSSDEYGKKDLNKAIVFFKKAEEKRDERAIYKLAKIYIEKQNVPELIKYLKKAADLGHLEAMGALGILYWKGIYGEKRIKIDEKYLTKNIKTSEKYFQKMIDLDYKKNADRLETLGFNEHKVKDHHATAFFSLGLIYQSEYKDLNQAIEYFEKAERLGSFPAVEALKNAQSKLQESMYESTFKDIYNLAKNKKRGNIFHY